ncbi:carbohydrate ABC transporter permease [Gracilibacillus alcaliphilus]|uniref:carbohydrate ABC transporter permease n=1 Tax=Gracilibacillus alcaliphilus TaxID=1401441 RepID=UPI00195CAD41|nr:carbohydrate ABC transporter permease [Gracilibacillus alcaliphilus]
MNVIKVMLMTVIAFIVLLPVSWMVLSSFRLEEEIFKFTELGYHLLIPENWTLQNYRDIFSENQRPLDRYMLNTLFIAVTGTFLGLLVNSFAAFSFAKMRFPLKRSLFVIFLSTLAIPFEAIMVPQYMIIRDFGWLDTYTALIVPQIVWAFGIFLLVQFFSDIPRSLIEAARIDGASWLTIFFRVAVPMSWPAIITLGIITFVGKWDEFLWALIVISDDAKQVIQIAIASYSLETYTSWGMVFAASTIASIPTMIIFLLLQKYYIQGVTTSGIK